MVIKRAEIKGPEPRFKGLWLALLLLTAISTSHCASTEASAEKAEEPRAIPVKTVALEPTEGYEVTSRYHGVIKARRTSQLSFLRGGLLRQITVDIGDSVTQGQVVAVLDQEALLAEMTSLEAGLRKAESRLLELERGPRIEPRRAAGANVRRQKEALELAQKKLERRRSLYEQGAVPLENLDESESEVRLLQESLEATVQDSQELESGTRPEVIEQARADVEQVRAQIAALKVQFRDSNLLAPFSGRIAGRHVDEGAVVSAGAAVLSLDEGGIYEVWLDLPLEEPLPPSVELQRGNETIKGVLVNQPPVVDPNSLTQTARYAITSGRPGETVSLELSRRVKQAGFWLPSDTLRASQKGLWTCYTVDQESRAVAQDLEELYREDRRTLVRGTIGPEDRVIQGGLDSVVSGQRVQVLP
jgi:multidrug efflux pump subunit AcrA (membrane-fusion protein)